MIRSNTARKTLAVTLALVTLTSSITAGVAFAAGSATAHGDHVGGGGENGSDEWATDSDSFRKETVVSGLERPMETVFLPDGRMLVVQQNGEILIDDPDTDGGPETYLDLEEVDSIESDRERGLLGIALDPNFEENGEFYLYYSRLDNPGAEEEADTEPENVLAKFTHRENDGGTTSRADPDSREVLWRNEIRTGNSIVCCHLGGGLDVGPDGKIYVTTGDEFQGDRAQDLSVPDGKIIRLNRDGSVPDDNPFAGDDDSDALSEIWAYGLRNPYRAQFGADGNLYVGEVGGNEEPESQEDIHIGEKGANYGWPDCEGECDSDEYTDPIYTYSHGESGSPEGAAVTVGPTYDGEMYPDEYDGALFYSDYNDGWLRYLTLSEDGTTVEGSYNFDERAGAIVSMEVGPEGALYGTNYMDQSGDGSVVRYVYEGETNSGPSIDSATASPQSGAAPLDVSFEASASDPNGDDLSYTWTFGDGETAEGASVTHTYDEPGSYEASVEVSDGETTVTSETIAVSAGGAPEVEITTPEDESTFRAGESVEIAADVSDPEDGRLSGDDVEWSVYLAHNDHVHPDTTATGESFTFDVPTTGHPTAGDVGYEVSVTATDSDGLQTTKNVSIRPEEVGVTLQTDPEGVAVDLEGSPQSTADGGHTFDTVIGYEHELSAPQSVCRDGTVHEFSGWSDGSTDRSRTYTVPDTDATLTAQYEAAGSCGAPNVENASISAQNGETTFDAVDRATDPDGDDIDPASVRIVDAPANGTATTNDDGTVTYAPDDSNATSDSFSYEVADENGDVSAPATVSVTIERPDSNGDGNDGSGPVPEEGDDSDGGDTGDGSDSGGDDTGDTDDGDDSGDGDDGNDSSGIDDGDEDRQSGSGGSESIDSLSSADERPSFEITNATLSETNVSAGDSVNVSAVVSNVGEADGDTTVDLAVENETVESRELSIEAGANTTVSFSHAFNSSGSYAVRLGNRSLGNVTVSESEQINDSSPEATSDGADGGDDESPGDGETTREGTTPAETESGDVETSSQTDGESAGDGEATDRGDGGGDASDREDGGGDARETPTSTPGFGPVVAVLAVLVAAATLAVRRRD